jgi:hypothetical protein
MLNHICSSVAAASYLSTTLKKAVQNQPWHSQNSGIDLIGQSHSLKHLSLNSHSCSVFIQASFVNSMIPYNDALQNVQIYTVQ